MIQVAMLGKLTHTDMADAILTHPPLAEGSAPSSRHSTPESYGS